LSRWQTNYYVNIRLCLIEPERERKAKCGEERILPSFGSSEIASKYSKYQWVLCCRFSSLERQEISIVLAVLRKYPSVPCFSIVFRPIAFGCAFFFFWVKMYFPPNYFNLNIFFFIFLLSNNSYYFSLFFIYFFPSHISTSSPLFLLLLPNTLLVICLYVGIC